MGASQRLTRPYVAPMLNVLLPKSRDPSPSVASSILTTLGELARVGGEDVLPELRPLMSLILDTLHDQASTPKRDAALKTLGQLSSHAGYVIDPYLDHPSLLGILIGLLKTEQSPHTRREVVRVMGILGALDPFRHTVSSPLFPLRALLTSHVTNRSSKERQTTRLSNRSIRPIRRIPRISDPLTTSTILPSPSTLFSSSSPIRRSAIITPPWSMRSCTSSVRFV